MNTFPNLRIQVVGQIPIFDLHYEFLCCHNKEISKCIYIEARLIEVKENNMPQGCSRGKASSSSNCLEIPDNAPKFCLFLERVGFLSNY